MSDTDTLAETLEAPAETPPTPVPAFDVEAFKSELTATFESKLNERIAGVQSSYQKQLNEKDAELRELRVGTMSDSERARFEDQEAEEYIEQLERRATLAEIGRKYPDIAEAFEKLLGAESPEAQAEILLALVKPATLTPGTPESEPAELVPAVDPNNPAPQGGTATELRLPDGTPVTEESAEAFLKALGNTPIGGYR